MILASGEGQLVFLVVMAVFGLINWLASKAKSEEPKGPAQPSSPRRADSEPEDERMRRFLEALGVPADSQPAPPPRVERRPQPPAIPKAPRRAPRPSAPPVLPEARRSRSLDELPAPTRRVEEIALPELVTHAVPDFETVSSKISAFPAGFPAAGEEVARPSGPTMSETLKAALASPRQLRSAFILTEVFGTPPGLRQP